MRMEQWKCLTLAYLRPRIFGSNDSRLIIPSWLYSGAALHRLLEFAAANSEFSHIPLIPVISVFLMVMRRHHIFADSNPYPSAGGVIVGVGILLFGKE
jgi:hypothetical protein